MLWYFSMLDNFPVIFDLDVVWNVGFVVVSHFSIFTAFSVLLILVWLCFRVTFFVRWFSVVWWELFCRVFFVFVTYFAMLLWVDYVAVSAVLVFYCCWFHCFWLFLVLTAFLILLCLLILMFFLLLVCIFRSELYVVSAIVSILFHFVH